MKILLSKPGLDGHDVGVKVLAHGLVEAGYEVRYTGLRKSIEEIIDQAVADHVDIIGMSILSGTHQLLCERMKELLRQRGLSIPWFVGGNIPKRDIATLEAIGAAKAFPTGSKVEDVIAFFKTFEMNANR